MSLADEDAHRMPDAVSAAVTVDRVQALMSRHILLYRRHAPIYQTILLRSLLALWDRRHRRVLDVGGGTGIMAQAMKELFSVEHVTAVDIHDRFLKSLDIETRTYDGSTLPFADASFDCVTLINVLHHVPSRSRACLLRECARIVGRGPIYIKDHQARSSLDHVRLFVLDAIGNVPFGGMVSARYLANGDWDELVRACGYHIEARAGGDYRSGLLERIFPNCLEVTLKLVHRT